jgi:hypothetical protein
MRSRLPTMQLQPRHRIAIRRRTLVAAGTPHSLHHGAPRCAIVLRRSWCSLWCSGLVHQRIPARRIRAPSSYYRQASSRIAAHTPRLQTPLGAICPRATCAATLPQKLPHFCATKAHHESAVELQHERSHFSSTRDTRNHERSEQPQPASSRNQPYHAQALGHVRHHRGGKPLVQTPRHECHSD